MKILVIRYKFIGDVLLSSTLCASLRKSFPDAQIDFLMHANAAPLFAGNADIDNVIPLSAAERKTLAYFKKIWRVTRAKYDIIVDATSTAKTEFISLFSSKSKFKIGRFKKGRGLFYTHRVAKQFDNKIEQRMAMLKPLVDAGFGIVEDRQLKLYPTDQEIELVDQQMRQAGVDRDRNVFALSVSSKFDYRYWNLDYMEEVVKHCLDKHNAQVVLLPGMPHEEDLISNFHARFSKQANIHSTIDAKSLRELCALLSQCDIYIGNEGAPRHFAEAVGLPTVCVFSPSANLDEWLPVQNEHHKAIEWRSVYTDASEPEYENDDATYHELYNSIKPAHFIPLIDDVVKHNL